MPTSGPTPACSQTGLFCSYSGANLVSTVHPSRSLPRSLYFTFIQTLLYKRPCYLSRFLKLLHPKRNFQCSKIINCLSPAADFAFPEEELLKGGPINWFCLRISKQSPAPDRGARLSKLSVPILGDVAVAALARRSSESTWALGPQPLPSLRGPGSLLSLLLYL